MRASENLCLHYASAGAPARRATISAESLRALVERRRAEGREAASLLAYAGGVPADGAFTLSFDDGHRSIVEVVAPLLSRLAVPATFFVPTAYVDTTDDFVTWDDLRRLRDLGFTIGSHADTHPRMPWRLYGETAAEHEARLTAELERSRELVARALGEAPALLAYPYGEAPDMARRAARRAGFAAAFTVAGTLEWDGDVLAIPRIDRSTGDGPTDADGAPIGLSVVVPASGRLGILADVVTRLASQTYPKDRYEVIVVDDGSPDDLSPAVEDMPDNVRLVELARDDSAVFHAGQARAHGASLARFDHLAFLDADVAVGPDFLWHLDHAHRHTPEAVVLGYLSGYNLHDLGHLHTPDTVRGADLGSLPVIPDRSREPTLRACLDNLDWLAAPWPLTYTGNLSVPRALFDRIGGFDGGFSGWGLEDVDLGYRLHRAGGRFLLARFEALHGRDPAVQAYVARSREDIDETCRRPMTVGIEFGGASSVRNRYHRRLHRMQPGGVPREELLDRVAYARKVGARTIYLLGGAPAEHPAFAEIVRAAKETVSWVSMQTLVHPFGEDPRRLDAPLDGAIAVVTTLDRESHERLHGPGTYAAFERGLAILKARVELGAHVVLSEETAPSFEATVRGLAERGIPVEELSVTEPRLAALGESVTGLSARTI